MSALESVVHAFRALDHRKENADIITRRNAYFEIRQADRHYMLADFLEKCELRLDVLLENYAAGDDAENGRLVKLLFQELGDDIHRAKQREPLPSDEQMADAAGVPMRGEI